MPSLTGREDARIETPRWPRQRKHTRGSSGPSHSGAKPASAHLSREPKYQRLWLGGHAVCLPASGHRRSDLRAWKLEFIEVVRHEKSRRFELTPCGGPVAVKAGSISPPAALWHPMMSAALQQAAPRDCNSRRPLPLVVAPCIRVKGKASILDLLIASKSMPQPYSNISLPGPTLEQPLIRSTPQRINRVRLHLGFAQSQDGRHSYSREIVEWLGPVEYA